MSHFGSIKLRGCGIYAEQFYWCKTLCVVSATCWFNIIQHNNEQLLLVWASDIIVMLLLKQWSGVQFPLPTKLLMINPLCSKHLLVVWVNISTCYGLWPPPLKASIILLHCCLNLGYLICIIALPNQLLIICCKRVLGCHSLPGCIEEELGGMWSYP